MWQGKKTVDKGQRGRGREREGEKRDLIKVKESHSCMSKKKYTS
jgi:hypothetical protein